MRAPIILPEACTANLRRLYTQQKQAEALYEAAASGVMTALGIDLKTIQSMDIDKGVITFKAEETKAESQAA